MLQERDERVAAADVEFADGTAVVRLRGDLDISMRAALSAQLAGLIAMKPDRLIFDMAAVSYLDCAVAAAIFGASGSVVPARKPVIRSPCPLVQRLLELTGLDRQCELEG